MHTDSLGLYLHIPFCQRKCPYCAFYSLPVCDGSPDRLVKALLREIDLYAITEPVETIYIGGGSPSCLPDELLMYLVDSLHRRFGSVSEFSIEFNPAQARADILKRLRQSGVNRLSIGAQSFQAAELRTLGRLHGPDEIALAVEAARAGGFENISLDLIFAVPGSDAVSWRQSLWQAMALAVQHLSAYSLTIEEGTPFDECSRRETWQAVDESTERAMYEQARAELEKGGFYQYEVSNFAREGFECRHNRRYWQNRPVVGIGPSAAGWYRRQRTSNVADVDGYVEAIQAGRFFYAEHIVPTPRQIAAETAVLNLRMRQGIDRDDYARQTGFSVDAMFPQAIRSNGEKGFLIDTGRRLYLSDLGLSFADAVAADFSLPD